VVGEFDVKDVGDDSSVPIEHARTVINIPLKGSRELDRLDFRLKRLSEGPVDYPVQGILEFLQQAHPSMLLARWLTAVEQDHGRSPKGSTDSRLGKWGL
jgi:hypothetical protein